MKTKLITAQYERLGITPFAVDTVLNAEKEVYNKFEELNQMITYNQLKVIEAMQVYRLCDTHFNWQSGYGYNDSGREVTESIFAKVFGGEDAIVRPLIVNGTHALTLCLTGVLRPGDKMLAISGRPYDTLENVIGTAGPNGSSLMEIGVKYAEINFLEDGSFDEMAIEAALKAEPIKMVYIQRSAGYSFRKAVQIADLEAIVKKVKAIQPETVVMVDNCYGEFLDYREPTEVGADLMAGSLIKNPGGGLALSGGYIVGKSALIELIAAKMTSPGIGKECGLTFGQTRTILQGLFLAPTVAVNALKSAILCAKTYESLGYEVCPSSDAYRSDIIQSVKLGSEDKIVSFCKGIQSASPVDSYVTPLPWDMPGYESPVVMAAGAFVQGSSIELSADAPIREPFVVYYQGGLTYDHGKLGVMSSLSQMERDGVLKK
ncbi:MAG: methionine gamma-lyase family protein [Clostridia bacterium]|nr:methionine gamma-lyase family protein [Clostridia bacterium]